MGEDCVNVMAGNFINIADSSASYFPYEVDVGLLTVRFH